MRPAVASCCPLTMMWQSGVSACAADGRASLVCSLAPRVALTSRQIRVLAEGLALSRETAGRQYVAQALLEVGELA